MLDKLALASGHINISSDKLSKQTDRLSQDFDHSHFALLQVRSEQSVILKTKEGKVVLTNSDEIGLKEWSVSLRTTLRCSHELLSGLAKKAGKIYGTDGNIDGKQ